MADTRLVWISFPTLNNAIDDLLGDPAELVGDRTAFLLRELQALLRAEGLLQAADVVVVAAREAYPEYQQIHAYVCQASRSFASGITHLGFYALGAIQPELPRILYREDDVMFTSDEADARDARNVDHDRRIAEVIRACLANGSRTKAHTYQIFLLTGPADQATVHLPNPISNTTTTSGGRPWAWTLGQRYARLGFLPQNPATTAELDAMEGK